MSDHDPRCDERHTPRQRCNRGMTPAAARLARLAVDASAVELPEEHAPPGGESEPDLVREAVATIEAPSPTVFVSREWDDTAAAVEQAHRPPATTARRPIAPSDPGRTAALIGAALGFALLLMTRRGRRPPADG